MIKGVFILGVGFALGYAKATHDQAEIQSLINETREFLTLMKEKYEETWDAAKQAEAPQTENPPTTYNYTAPNPTTPEGE